MTARMKRLAPQLDREFDASTALERVRRIRSWLVANILVSFVCLGLDAGFVPSLLEDAILGRLVIAIPLHLLAVRLLSPRSPGWLQVGAVALPTGCTIAVAAYLGGHSPEPYADRYIMAAGLTCCLINLNVPLRFGQAWRVACCTLPIFAGVTLAGGPIGRNIDLVAFMVILTLGSLLTVRRLEAGRQSIFLLDLENRQRAAELARANEHLRRLAQTDFTTGVPNRRFFDASIKRAWDEACLSGESLALLMVDVDHFKLFNDKAGHLQGDDCLSTVAQAIQGSAEPASGMVARYGGEEFVVLLPGISASGVAAIGERVRAGVEQLGYPHPGLPDKSVVTVSVGGASVRPGEDSSVADLIRRADGALYRSKAAGRNRSTVAEQGVGSRAGRDNPFRTTSKAA